MPPTSTSPPPPCSVLLAAPVPPPVSGQSAATGMLLRHLESTGVEHDIVDLARPLEGITGAAYAVRRAAESLQLPLEAWRRGRRLAAPVVFYQQLGQSPRGMMRDLPLLELAARRRWPTVVHVHGGGFRAGFEAAPRPLQRLVARALARVERAVVLTPGLRRLFDGLVPDERIVVVSNGVDDTLADAARHLVGRRASRPRRGDALTVLFLSNLMETKGYVTVLEAARLAAEHGLAHRFVLAGAQTHETTVDPNEFVRRHALEDTVDLTGPVHGEAKHAIFADADVFTLPTAYPIEGQPISILEAMHFGLPVVTTRQGGIPDIFEAPGQAELLVDARSPAALLEAIERLATDADLRQRVAEANLAQARRTFTTDAHGQALTDLFAEVAASRSRR